MSAKPAVPFKHREGGEIALVPLIYDPFIRLMDYLYPALVSNSTVRKGQGYSAFLVTPVATHFVGSFTGLCLASVRKNPFFIDDNEWFMRSLLAGMHKDGTAEDHRSRCAAANYGTLRLWQKLGLGAKRTSRGDYISVTQDPTSYDVLTDALRASKEGYADIRASAAKRMSNLDPNVLKQAIPSETMLTYGHTLHTILLTKDRA